MIQSSRVFTKNHRNFRSFVRLRLKLVQKRTDLKNEAHSILAYEMFNLKDVLTDIFGKNGRITLFGVLSGKTVDQIIESLSPKLRKKYDQIRYILQRNVPKHCNQTSDMS